MNPASYTILVVEDDPSLAKLLRQNLEFEGYRVIQAFTGTEAFEKALLPETDLIVLDLMLPQMSGLEVCRRLRARGHRIPILMLTAKGTTEDKVKGLRTGADDYLTKPFELVEFLARTEAMIRRLGKKHPLQDVYSLGSYTFDFIHNTIDLPSGKIELTRQEARLMRYLVHHKGLALTREQIMEDVWSHNYLYSDRTIDTHITRLRQKLEPDPSNPRFILTVHRVGYKFVMALGEYVLSVHFTYFNAASSAEANPALVISSPMF